MERERGSASASTFSLAQADATRFETLEGTYELRGSASYAFPHNQLIRTSVSFMTVRSLAADPLRVPMPDNNTPLSAKNRGASSPTLQQMFIPSKIGSAGSSAQNSSTALANAPPTGPGITFADTAIGDGSTDGNSGEKEKFFGKMRRKTSFYIPNSNAKANTSTFVNKIVTYDNLALFLTSRGPEAHYFFINIGRQFLWADYTLETKPALSCLQLKEAFVTCHDVNPLTRENMDTVLGFNTGDIMIYSPISGKYDRKNKQFVISKSAVTCIKWMPGSESLFMVGFADGAVMILDKDREDSSTVVPLSSDESTGFPIYKPPKGAHKHNPISQWQLSKRPITSIQFSPDSVHVAVTSSDGCLRILDHTTERLLDTCSSYFGGLICCAWSPDGKYVVTGGEDDLVTIWAFGGRIVARCQGHSSWVTSVAFDPYNCTERSYRFASVSDDTRICMWDFSASSLHKPRVRKSRYVDSDKVATNNVHPVLSKKQVAILEPFMTQSIHTEPLHFIAFREDSVVTADRIGVVKFWSRPKVDILEDGDL